MLKTETLRPVLFVVFGIIILSSCVTNKKIQYLQKDDVNVEVPLDSIIRTYYTIDFDYKIQPYDRILVRIISLTDLEFDFFSKVTGQTRGGNQQNLGELVDENGKIEFPIVGKLKVGGLTIFEIEEKIQQIAIKYLDNPIVKVRLLNFRFTVLGEVNGQGTQNLDNTRVSISEAIGMAGGLSELADRSKIKLIRQYGNKVDVLYINLLDENIIYSPYYYMHQNDVLIVPPLKQRPFRRYFTQNLGIFLSSLSTLLLVISLLII